MNRMDILLLIILLGIAWYTSQIAERKGRSPLGWFILGFLFGLFGLAAIYFVPPLKRSSDPNTIEVEPVIIEKTPKFDTEKWYYLDLERKQQGPFSFQELQNLWVKRTIGVQTYVWCASMSGWKRIGEITDLVDALL